MSNTVITAATYSVEDNKLRLYVSARLDDDLYRRVKNQGFKWAPKQELFVAPSWSPDREDFCVELAGDIEPEEMTLVERAELKAMRLDALAEKRAGQAGAFAAAAHRISERFASGQPILIGHHSERKARKDKAQMEREMQKAVDAHNAVDYWRYRATGVERHANRKADSGVRARRIKTLLAEMRDFQRKLNHANKCLELWTAIDATEDQEKREKMTRYYIGAANIAPHYRGKSLYSLLEDNEVTVNDAIERCIQFHTAQAQNPYTFRWINHLLNRLAYERDEMGDVPRYEGELTPVILQTFAREQGADKPKASPITDGFALESAVPLPLHLGEGKRIELTTDEWRELMKSVGHAVVIKTRKKSTTKTVPLINPSKEDAEKLQALWNSDARKTKYGSGSETTEMTQQKYSTFSGGSYTPYETITLDQYGRKIWNSMNAAKKGLTATYRVRVGHGGKLYSADRVIILSDKPRKPLPFDLDALVEASQQATEEATA